jgi:large subunit GTPase 1
MRTAFDLDFTGSVCLIGYPNVGKSSTINLILQKKKVRVSSTPGKTKWIQTIETPNFTLLDCPGLVFPRHTKIDLVLMGILNIDQITDLDKYQSHVIDVIGVERLVKEYKITEFEGDFLTAMSNQKGWIKSTCLKRIVRDYSMGTMF